MYSFINNFYDLINNDSKIVLHKKLNKIDIFANLNYILCQEIFTIYV